MMILEQIQKLEILVTKTVSTIKDLQKENIALKKHLEELESGVSSLNKEAESRQAMEEKIQAGIKGILDELESLNDSDTSASGHFSGDSGTQSTNPKSGAAPRPSSPAPSKPSSSSPKAENHQNNPVGEKTKKEPANEERPTPELDIF